MGKRLRKYWKSLKKEISSHRLVYLLLALTFIGGLFIRTYRTDQVLGFYYDQGRDAKEIWELWHEGDLMLIGPTTGIAGIFRGPFYFYLIAPSYLLGGGNPIVPAYFLSFLSMLAALLAYYLGMKISNRTTGLFAAIIISFSFYIMVASRWLSNPTPMLLLSLILVWMMMLINEGKRWPWIVVGLVSGLSLFHFGSSGEFFYFPALLIFLLWQVFKKSNKKKSKEKGHSNTSMYWSRFKDGLSKTMGIKMFLLSSAVFLFTASPLILFDFLKGHILSNNFHEFMTGEETFKISVWEVAKIRFPFYYDVFTSKIFHWIRQREKILLIVVALGFVGRFRILIKKDGVKILLILLLSPMIGLLFFQGNHGNVYDYYLTGYYLIFLLLFAVVLGEIWNLSKSHSGSVKVVWTIFGKGFVIFFLYVFLSWNWMISWNRISAGSDGPNTIVLGNQIQAVEWIFNDAKGREFNTDVYVPPVIPHAYDYLFTWVGSTRYNQTPAEELVDLLYTLAEVDPPHPERLQAWEERQAGIGEVEETVHFGGIKVQRRDRIYNEEGTK